MSWRRKGRPARSRVGLGDPLQRKKRSIKKKQVTTQVSSTGPERKHINLMDVSADSAYGITITGEIYADENQTEDGSRFYMAEKEHDVGWYVSITDGRPLSDKEIELIAKEARKEIRGMV